MSEKKLNLGCGVNIKTGWINMDCVDLPGVVYFHDINPSYSGFPGVLRAAKEFFLVTYAHNKKKNKLKQLLLEVFNTCYFEVWTIEELADVLYSSRERYLMYSGAASLAAALQSPGTVLCNRKSSPHFQYNLHRYISLLQ